jgi:hypothetical protein
MQGLCAANQCRRSSTANLIRFFISPLSSLAASFLACPVDSLDCCREPRKSSLRGQAAPSILRDRLVHSGLDPVQSSSLHDYIGRDLVVIVVYLIARGFLITATHEERTTSLVLRLSENIESVATNTLTGIATCTRQSTRYLTGRVLRWYGPRDHCISVHTSNHQIQNYRPKP